MRLCIKLILILVILATCLEVNQAKKRGGSSSSSSRGSSSRGSSSRGSSSRGSSSSSRGSSIGSKVSSIATKIKNAVKPKPKTNTNPQSSYPKQQFGSNSGVPSSSGSSFSGGSSQTNPQSSYPKQQFGSNTGVHSSSGSSFSGGSSQPKPPKKESKVKKRLKQAALIGAGAYVGYKLGKLKEKFSNRKWGGHSSSSSHISIGSSSIRRRPRYDFDDWNDWREADGFLCRSNDDCKWFDGNLNCEDYELDFSPARGWFGGDTVSIRGECTCEQGYRWNEQQLSCDRIYPRFRPGSAPSLQPHLSIFFITILSLMTKFL